MNEWELEIEELSINRERVAYIWHNSCAYKVECPPVTVIFQTNRFYPFVCQRCLKSCESESYLKTLIQVHNAAQ